MLDVCHTRNIEGIVYKIVAVIVAGALAASIFQANAQIPEQQRARQLMAAGQPSAALSLLESVNATHTVLEDRARAHLMLAEQTVGPQRCSHARDGFENAAMASNSELVDLAQRIIRDSMCPLAPDTAK